MITARRRAIVAAAVLGALILANAASGHIERASYWPDPGADTSVTPPAGGSVPVARSLASALKRKPPGKSITSSPPAPLLPDCNNGQDPSMSTGNGIPPSNEAELVQCLAGFSTVGYDPNACPWFVTPPKPSS
jgi:hypothetical protein